MSPLEVYTGVHSSPQPTILFAIAANQFYIKLEFMT